MNSGNIIINCICEYVPTDFEISISFSRDVKCKQNKYICYKGEDSLDVLVDKMNKVLKVFA